jgi:hypothetical protein
MPLRWIQDKAEATGLKLKVKIIVGESDYLSKISDSYAEFMYGAYRLVKKRFIRKFGGGVKETVDPTVWTRYQSLEYRPPTLAGHPDTPNLV